MPKTKSKLSKVGTPTLPKSLGAAANSRLAAQTRKLLAKHYANKYGVRKG
jgi:hypothetical protein